MATYDQVKFPFGPATTLAPAYAATIAVDVWNAKTFLNLSLTGDATLNITPDAELETGAELLLKVTASADGYDLTLGSSIDGPAIVGVSTKTKTQNFIYNGSAFVPVGTAVQID